jgi:hypothetical protein
MKASYDACDLNDLLKQSEAAQKRSSTFAPKKQSQQMNLTPINRKSMKKKAKSASMLSPINRNGIARNCGNPQESSKQNSKNTSKSTSPVSTSRDYSNPQENSKSNSKNTSPVSTSRGYRRSQSVNAKHPKEFSIKIRLQAEELSGDTDALLKCLRQPMCVQACMEIGVRASELKPLDFDSFRVNNFESNVDTQFLYNYLFGGSLSRANFVCR